MVKRIYNRVQYVEKEELIKYKGSKVTREVGLSRRKRLQKRKVTRKVYGKNVIQME